MSDYAIYGKCNKDDVRLMIINESDWSMEEDISPIPLTEPTNLYEENEYWVECTTGEKLVFIKDEEEAIIAKGKVDAVLYWSAAFNNNYWEDDPLNETLSWSWDGSKWSVTNGTGVDTMVYLLAKTSVSEWTTDYRPGFFKVALSYSGTPPTGTIGGFCSGRTVSFGGLNTTFGENGLIRSKSGLSSIINAGYNIERFGIIIPAGQTVSITGLWFSTQIWLPDINTWVTHMDPTKWNDGGNANLAWSTDKWILSDDCSVTLTASGTWNDIGRPSAMRLTFDYTDTDLVDVVLTDTSANTLCDVDGVVPGQIIPIVTQGNDIDELTITLRGPSSCTGKTLEITDIEFYYGTNAITWGGYDTLSSAIKSARNTSGTDDGAFYTQDTRYQGITANITSGKELTFYSDTSTQFTAGLYNSSGTALSGPVTSSGVDSLQEIKFTDVGNFYAVVRNTTPSEDSRDIFSYTLVTPPVEEGGEESCPGYTDAATAMANITAFEDGTPQYGDELPTYLDIEASKFLAVNFSTIETIEQYNLTYTVTADSPFTVRYFEGTDGDVSLRQTLNGSFDGAEYTISWGNSGITTILGNTHLYTVIENTGETCDNFRIHMNWSSVGGGEGAQSFTNAADAISWAGENLTHQGYNNGQIIGGEGGEGLDEASTISVAAGKYGAIKYYDIYSDYFGNGSTINMLEGGEGDDVYAWTYSEGGEGGPQQESTIGGENAGPSVGGEGVNFYHYDPCYIVIFNPTETDFNYEIYFIAGNGNV